MRKSENFILKHTAEGYLVLRTFEILKVVLEIKPNYVVRFLCIVVFTASTGSKSVGIVCFNIMLFYFQPAFQPALESSKPFVKYVCELVQRSKKNICCSN